MGHEDCFKISEYLMTTEIVIRDILNSVSCVNTRVNNLAGDSTEDLALYAKGPNAKDSKKLCTYSNQPTCKHGTLDSEKIVSASKVENISP